MWFFKSQEMDRCVEALRSKIEEEGLETKLVPINCRVQRHPEFACRLLVIGDREIDRLKEISYRYSTFVELLRMDNFVWSVNNDGGRSSSNRKENLASIIIDGKKL